MFRTQGVMTTKAALASRACPPAAARPMAECSPEEIEQLKIDLAAGGYSSNTRLRAPPRSRLHN